MNIEDIEEEVRTMFEDFVNNTIIDEYWTDHTEEEKVLFRAEQAKYKLSYIKIDKSMEDIITQEELIEFYSYDTVEEIAGYTSANLNALARGIYTVEQFVNMHRPEELDDE